MKIAQNQVRDLVADQRLSTDVSVRLHDLASEVGELNKAFLKATDYGRRPFTSSENWEEELGDVAFALCCVANSTGVDLNAVLDQVLLKYRARFQNTQSPASGP